MMMWLLILCSFIFANATDKVNFLFFGDWGYAGANQTLIAAQMGEWSGNNKADFLVALGDNFYKRGVSNDTDLLWQTLYSNVYTSPHLQIPWYAILGNHDYIHNAEAQIDFYKNKRDNRWTMPDHIYNVIYQLADSYPGAPPTASLEIVFIDTSMIAPTIFGEDITPKQRDEALEKVESFLSKSTATWLFVAGHYTIYSTAEHGNTQELIASLVPLLRKYKVHAYLNGHDHLLQHLLVDEVNYVTSGRGTLTDNYPANEADNLRLHSKDELKYRSLSIGFNSATVTSTSVSIRFHNGAKGGQVEFTYELTNPRTSQVLDDNEKDIANQEKHRHVIKIVLVGVLCLLIGVVCGVFAPTSLRVTLSKWFCGGYFKFCERKLSGSSLNTMVPDTESTDTSNINGGSGGGQEPWSQRMLKKITSSTNMINGNSGGGVYGRIDTSEHGTSSSTGGIELGQGMLKENL